MPAVSPVGTEPEEGPPVSPGRGGGEQKGGPQIRLRTFVAACRDTRPELTKN